jgi:hypothetical protein
LNLRPSGYEPDGHFRAAVSVGKAKSGSSLSMVALRPYRRMDDTTARVRAFVIDEQAVRFLGTIWHTQPEKERILTNPGEALSNWKGSKLDKYLIISMS